MNLCYSTLYVCYYANFFFAMLCYAMLLCVSTRQPRAQQAEERRRRAGLLVAGRQGRHDEADAEEVDEDGDSQARQARIVERGPWSCLPGHSCP